jgi:hypothetical protein
MDFYFQTSIDQFLTPQKGKPGMGDYGNIKR